MGMNYYATKPKCPTCGHIDVGFHIGKKAAGWKFHFQCADLDWDKDRTARSLISWNQMKEYIVKNALVIEDEGNEILSMEEFEKIVHSEGMLNVVNIMHNKPTNDQEREYCRPKTHCPNLYERDRYNFWNDEDGYSFSRGDFS